MEVVELLVEAGEVAVAAPEVVDESDPANTKCKEKSECRVRDVRVRVRVRTYRMYTPPAALPGHPPGPQRRRSGKPCWSIRR